MSGKPMPVVRSIVAEVLAVLRLAFTLKLDPRAVIGRDATIALLGTAALVIWLLLHWWQARGPVRFEVSTLVDIAAAFAVATGFAWLLSRLGAPHLPIRQTLWLVAGYLPAAAVGAWLLNARISRSLVVTAALVLAAHAALYFYFGLRA